MKRILLSLWMMAGVMSPQAAGKEASSSVFSVTEVASLEKELKVFYEQYKEVFFIFHRIKKSARLCVNNFSNEEKRKHYEKIHDDLVVSLDKRILDFLYACNAIHIRYCDNFQKDQRDMNITKIIDAEKEAYALMKKMVDFLPLYQQSSSDISIRKKNIIIQLITKRISEIDTGMKKLDSNWSPEKYLTTEEALEEDIIVRQGSVIVPQDSDPDKNYKELLEGSKKL